MIFFRTKPLLRLFFFLTDIQRKVLQNFTEIYINDLYEGIKTHCLYREKASNEHSNKIINENNTPFSK